MTAPLVAPYGGELVDLQVDAARAAELVAASRAWPSWELTPRQRCDLELLATGGFSPLTGFLARDDHERVLAEMRLDDGTLWPIPITLDVDAELATTLARGDRLALRDPEGALLAALHVADVWEADHEREARQLLATTDPHHPGVARLLKHTHPWYVGGRLEVLRAPVHHDFPELRLTPRQLRARLAARGWSRVVAFQTRNPMHRAHVELTRRAAREADAALLLHPVVGATKPGDVDHYTRVRVYRAVADRYPPATVELALLPLAMRMAGPREALWHAIIRRNHGCTHLVVGRDHAGPGSDATGTPFYGPYEAQELLAAHAEEIGVAAVPFRQVVYVADRDAYVPVDEVRPGEETRSLSGTELRRLLAEGAELPEWFTFPEVAAELRRSHPPRHERGAVIFLTGLSGAGKSTVANVVAAKLLEAGRRVTLLDGDLVRTHLSSELGFSKEHRDLNVRRIGFVAAEVAKHGGIAICAPIAPYDAARREVRAAAEAGGARFLLVHVATPLEVCERRDPKGLYAKARAGLIRGFTGVDDPYEPPTDAELTLDTAELSPAEATDVILAHLAAGHSAAG